MWSAIWLLSRREWVNVSEPKHEATLWIEKKRLWCRQGLLWGLFIQLMTLAESDSIIMCLWCRRQLEADNSIALTTAFSSASLESKIPTDKEKIQRIIPLWFHKTPPIPEGPGFPREEPSTFHLKLLIIGGDHTTTRLWFLELVHRNSPSADLSKSEAE